MAFDDLAIIIHEQIGAVAMEHAGASAGDGGGVARLGFQTVASSFNANDVDIFVVEEGMEQAHGVGAAADGCHKRVRQASFALQHLRLGFLADDRLEIAHHLRIRVRASNGADAVEGVFDIGDPIPQRFIEVRPSRCANRDLAGTTSAPSNFHAEHVGLLAFDINLAHIDHAFQAEAGAGGGRGHAMLGRHRFRQ